MKKLLAALFLIAAAIIAAASAYPLDIEAQVFGGFDLLNGSTNLDRQYELFDLNSGKVKIETQAQKENFGGFLRFGYNIFLKEYFIDFDLWWQKSKKFAFYITYNEDGHFALDNIAGDNFYGFPGEVLDLQGCARGRAFFDGFLYGAFINYNPADAFELYWGLNMFKPDIPEYMFKSMTFQFVYNLGTKGKIGLTLEGDYMTEEDLNDNPVIYLYYNHARFKDVDIDIGLSYQILEKRDLEGYEHTRHHPINLGIGVTFPYKKVNFKTRLSASFLGKDIIKSETIDEENKSPFDIGIDILPSYVFKKNITGYLNLGLGLSVPEEGESDFFWRINPYVVFGDVNAASFYAGLALYNTAIDQDALHFSISAGLSFIF